MHQLQIKSASYDMVYPQCLEATHEIFGYLLRNLYDISFVKTIDFILPYDFRFLSHITLKGSTVTQRFWLLRKIFVIVEPLRFQNQSCRLLPDSLI